MSKKVKNERVEWDESHYKRAAEGFAKFGTKPADIQRRVFPDVPLDKVRSMLNSVRFKKYCREKGFLNPHFLHPTIFHSLMFIASLRSLRSVLLRIAETSKTASAPDSRPRLSYAREKQLRSRKKKRSKRRMRRESTPTLNMINPTRFLNMCMSKGGKSSNAEKLDWMPPLPCRFNRGSMRRHLVANPQSLNPSLHLILLHSALQVVS